MQEQIRDMLDGYAQFLKGADGILIALRSGGIKPQFATVAEEIARVEKQMRDVEDIVTHIRRNYGSPTP